MNSGAWSSISNVFLVIGILFLIITIVLSIKFQLFSIIKAELQNRKDAGGQEYFAYAESKSKLNNTVEQFSQDEGVESFRFDTQTDVNYAQERTASATVPSFRSRGNMAQNEPAADPATARTKIVPEDNGSATVLSSSARKRNAQENNGSATVLSSSARKRSAPEDNSTATMLISSARKQNAPANEGSATIVTSRKRDTGSTAVSPAAAPRQESAVEGFVIIDNILIIHGDPGKIQGNNA